MTDEKKTPALRVADTDREEIAELLRNAVAEGRLELAELDDRLTAAYSAKTRAELDTLTADLPAVPGVTAEPLHLRTKSGTVKRNGPWNVPDTIDAECTSGLVKLDFTEANCPHRVVEVEARARSGSVVLVVPRGWGVDMDQAWATSGSVVNKLRAPHDPTKPLLRVKGEVRSGTIKARHRYRSFWGWLTRQPKT
ncbi:DUF1707 domain-containing protein [Spiractinospora alimapuensis]|uniref:DUF1707 SHOCT-like domain-containing protein n=1 Tax=Spiractinospora alimapuensis TaxID=2820884 RepID=UPI001F30D12F|nr:DUF1707 domain-containing protein [Spiractinospora alimapuensis]QVQ50779.1 DUF1707 domain-containing protein [Spiractinospora alimapuensis]